MSDRNGDVNNLPPDEGSSSSMGSSGGGICVACGSTLGIKGPEGGCLNCFARFALAPEEDEAEDGEPLLPSRTFGHFEIVFGPDGWPVELGRGAMGVTYRARDTVLHTDVALKVIGVGAAGRPAARAAFLREARAAARLRHANVASVFHYGEQDGECFYVMELIEGETLESRVRRDGPLPVLQALEIGEQVARALAAAEACGVVHRDLKPSNIMLAARQAGAGGVDTITVKVIDWGLAKAVTAGQTHGDDQTRAGFVGTPAFASPEQYARSEDERVDTRSDIYSLGVTLWYLLCGKLPFVGQTLTEIHEQQTRLPLPLNQLKEANVPAPVTALLSSMLATAPVARPQSARELLNVYSQCLAQISPARDATRRRYFAWAAVCCLLVVVAASALAVWWRGIAMVADTPHPSVAVLPFENLSPNPADAFFTKGVQDAITANLARIAQLKVIGADSVKAYPAGKPRDLPAISRALVVTNLLEGTIRRNDGRVHIELRLTDPHDPNHVWTRQYDRPLTEEFALLGELTRAVAERLHTPPTPAEIADINRRPTHDPVAYDLYLRAKEGPNIYLNEIKLREQVEQRILLLNEAVARDPAFALAYCALAGAHDNIASHLQQASTEEKAVDHRALAEAALARASRLQPDAGEVHLALANHFYLITRDFEQARVEIELARRSLPNSVPVESLSGRVALRQGHGEDAVRALEKVVVLNPRSLAGHGQLEEAYEYLRRYDGADRELAILETLLPPGALATLTASRAMLVLEARADVAPLRAAVAEMTDAQDPDRDLRDTYGLIIAVFTHDERQIRYLLAASKKTEYVYADFTYPKAWYQALAARIRQDAATAQAAFAVARVEVEKTVLANPLDERNLLLLAMIDAGLGHNEDAVREAQRACAMPPLQSERSTAPSDRCCLAVVYAWTNQPDLAFTELDSLVSGPAGANIPSQPTYGDMRLNPLWDPLRKDARFDALVSRLAPKSAP
jgi:TolB-like protein